MYGQSSRARNSASSFSKHSRVDASVMYAGSEFQADIDLEMKDHLYNSKHGFGRYSFFCATDLVCVVLISDTYL